VQASVVTSHRLSLRFLHLNRLSWAQAKNFTLTQVTRGVSVRGTIGIVGAIGLFAATAADLSPAERLACVMLGFTFVSFGVVGPKMPEEFTPKAMAVIGFTTSLLALLFSSFIESSLHAPLCVAAGVLVAANLVLLVHASDKAWYQYSADDAA